MKNDDNDEIQVVKTRSVVTTKKIGYSFEGLKSALRADAARILGCSPLDIEITMDWATAEAVYQQTFHEDLD